MCFIAHVSPVLYSEHPYTNSYLERNAQKMMLTQDIIRDEQDNIW